jgi:hypothetical protein
MIRPSKQKAQQDAMTEAHKVALVDLEAQRHEEGHAARVDAFNAMITTDLGADNVGFIVRSYN